MSTKGEEVGMVRRLFRYPVKSMAGEEVTEARVWWHGIEGDRRHAFVRTGNTSHFPWLTARQVPAMLRYRPYFRDPTGPITSPVHVETPQGCDLPLESAELRDELACAYGGGVHLMQVSRGAFDDMELSVLSVASLRALSDEVGVDLDVRRVRQNVIVETASGVPYAEDEWPGGLLTFGDGDDTVSVRVARRIPRCMMVNLSPDTAVQDPRVLKELVRSRDSCFGIYGAIDKTGIIRVGDVVYLRRE